MFVRTIYAMGQQSQQAAAGPANASSVFLQMVPLILIFAVFYFLIIRPQQQKHKKHLELLNNIKKGDKVVTIGGMIGTVVAVKDNTTISLDISNGVKIDILKNSISSLLEEGKSE